MEVTNFKRMSVLTSVKVKVKVTLRLTVGQSVRLGVEPHLGLMTRYLLLFDSYGLQTGIRYIGAARTTPKTSHVITSVTSLLECDVIAPARKFVYRAVV
jgi:hypothetical protein